MDTNKDVVCAYVVRAQPQFETKGSVRLGAAPLAAGRSGVPIGSVHVAIRTSADLTIWTEI
jgi:hypothetical protein